MNGLITKVVVVAAAIAAAAESLVA